MNFQTIFRNDPKSLQDLRDSIDEAIENTPDFIALLEDHHTYIKESIDVLMDSKADVFDKQIHLSRFAALVEMHGHAEEETLYDALESSPERKARIEGFGGQDEHLLAYQMISELDSLDALNSWSDEIEAKAKTVAGLVKNHIKEEETMMFKIARKSLAGSELDRLAQTYSMKCRDFFMRKLPPPAELITEITTITTQLNR